MSIVAISGGTFDDSTHTYRDEGGVWIPSLTAILKLQGLSSYPGCIKREVMEHASERGTSGHQIAWSYAKYQDVDPSWINEELEPRYTAIKRFFAETNFKPDVDWLEQPMIATVCGMKFGVTPDALGVRGKWPQIVELKLCDAEQKSWAIQTAAQEMAYFSANRCGRAKRMAVMFKSDGKYKLCPHENHESDTATFLAALRLVYWRLNAGQKLWEREL